MEEKKIDRREFIKRSTRSGAAVAATAGLGFWLRGRSERPVTELIGRQAGNYLVDIPAGTPDMAVVEGGSPRELLEAALDALGGIETFISQGDVVVLKPNVGWDRVPQQAANTNPDLIKCLIETCFNAGAKKVVVTDVSCNDARRCFHRSGIQKSAQSVGADVVLPEERKFRDFNLHGEILNIWPVFTPIIEADKVINVPIVKHHNLAKATMGLKNWYGIIGGRRNQLHQNIDLSIADLATFMRPTLTIMDAYRVLTANGPQGGNLKDVKTFKTLIAGTDPVAIDAFGAGFLGLTADEIPYLRFAHERGVGNKNFNELNIRNVKLGT